jgi:hypothetical protein
MTEELLKQAGELDLDSQILIASKFLGYRELPPTIEKFVTDPYYLGKCCTTLYPFWKKKLMEIFPTCIHNRYPLVIFTGGIGCGKSTISTLMAMYLLCRLFHLKDPHATLGIMKAKGLMLSFFTESIDLGKKNFLKAIETYRLESPYFQLMEEEGKFDIIEMVADGVRSNSQIGADVIFYNLSELNLVSRDVAQEKLLQAINRFDSRFGRVSDYFGQIILDSSSKDEDSVVDTFINNKHFKDVYVVFCNQWIVKEHLNEFFRKGSFQVYKGDSVHAPFIIRDKNQLLPEMDKERVLDVPEELREYFEFSVVQALRDRAGVSTANFGRFFTDVPRLLKCFDIPNYIGLDVVKFDFFDKTDKLIDKLQKALDKIPKGASLYIRYDLGTVKDYTGIAIAYHDGWEQYDKSTKSSRQPIVVIPLACGISRYDGQETSIVHLYNFILDLHKKWHIGGVTLDQFGSNQLIQDLKREKIIAERLSVDKDDQAYIRLKTLVSGGLVHMNNNELLKKELIELNYTKQKVDHPSKGCFIGSTLVLCKNKITHLVIDKTLESLVKEYNDYEISSYSISSDSFEWVNIKNAVLTKYVKELVKLEFENETECYCTKDHLILTDEGYVEAEHLEKPNVVFMKLINKSIVIMDKEVPVYDIEVDSDNRNFCLTNGVVAHNSKDIADAVAGVVLNLCNNTGADGVISSRDRVQGYSDFIKSKLEEDNNPIQTMLDNIYKR